MTNMCIHVSKKFGTEERLKDLALFWFWAFDFLALRASKKMSVPNKSDDICLSRMAVKPELWHVWVETFTLKTSGGLQVPVVNRDKKILYISLITKSYHVYIVAYQKNIHKSGDIYSIYFFITFLHSPYIYNKKNVILYIFFFVYIVFIYNYIHIHYISEFLYYYFTKMNTKMLLIWLFVTAIASFVFNKKKSLFNLFLWFIWVIIIILSFKLY